MNYMSHETHKKDNEQDRIWHASKKFIYVLVIYRIYLIKIYSQFQTHNGVDRIQTFT